MSLLVQESKGVLDGNLNTAVDLRVKTKRKLRDVEGDNYDLSQIKDLPLESAMILRQKLDHWINLSLAENYVTSTPTALTKWTHKEQEIVGVRFVPKKLEAKKRKFWEICRNTQPDIVSAPNDTSSVGTEFLINKEIAATLKCPSKNERDKILSIIKSAKKNFHFNVF
jgi:hypothetical protein